jgi:hypothetical protein
VIVALGGFARAGKDSAAQALVDHLGFRRVAFADKLREFLLRLNPLVAPGVQPAFGAHKSITTVQKVIDEYGWDGYKDSPYGDHMREYMQRLGTECGRELISDSIWIDAALKDTEDNIVIPDLRFGNELAAIKARGGHTIRIVRPGVGPVNNHPSEFALTDDDFDYVIMNSSSLEDLHSTVIGTVQHLA